MSRRWETGWYQPQRQVSKLPAQEVVGLGSCFPEIRSVKPWYHFRLARQPDQTHLPPRTTPLLTFGTDVKLCSEAKRASSDIDRDSQGDV